MFKSTRNSSIIICLFLLLLLFLILFSGCSSKPKNYKEITMWVMPNSQEPARDVEKVLLPFHAANPGIKVSVTSLDWGSAWQKITAAATSGTGPDIIQLGSTWVGMVASMHSLGDLTKKANLISAKNLFTPLSWRSSGIINSKEITAIPWIVDARAMFYRTDVFRRLGLTVKDISTWQSFEKTLARIKKAQLVVNGMKVNPLGITGKNDWNVVHNLAPWIWAGGGSFFDKSFKKSNLYASNAAKGISFYTGLAKKGYVPMSCLEKNSYQISSEFFNGKYAIYFDGPYALKTLTTPSERGGAADLPVARNFGVAPYPKGPYGRFTYGGGSNLAIFRYSKNKDAAWKVIEYLTTNKEAQVAYAKLTGFLPANKKAFKDPYFSENPQLKVFVKSINFARNYPSIPQWGSLEMTTLPRRFGLMWSEAMEDIQNFDYKKARKQMLMADKEINAVLSQ